MYPDLIVAESARQDVGFAQVVEDLSIQDLVAALSSVRNRYSRSPGDCPRGTILKCTKAAYSL